MNTARNEAWINDGKDGKSTLVYDEASDGDTCIRVSGSGQEALADRLVGLLNADKPGQPTYSELVEALRAQAYQTSLLLAQLAPRHLYNEARDLTGKTNDLLARIPA